MAEASDCAKAEPFIYGEEPSKVDRLVFDALYQCQICPEQYPHVYRWRHSYPHVYRWRHSVALYPPEQRDKWQPAQTEDSMNVSISLGAFSPAPPRPRATCSTPQRERDTARAPPLQVMSCGTNCWD
ncbi:hypothetical protein B5X24_HaOG215336 [Helicoverpa armigera]|nr:hypothetical protein B5X24_HaOG215336 [Helicoverpa armigera]